MNDPLDAIFVTGDEAAELKRTDTARKLATYLERMPAKLRGMFAEQFQHISSAELAQLRDDSLLLIGSNRLLSEIGALLNCAPDATILDSISALRSDLQAEQARVKEFESGALVSALLEANRTQADIIIEQARQLEEARDTMIAVKPHLPISGDGFNTLHSSRVAIDSWLAANPAQPEPSAEPQP